MKKVFSLKQSEPHRAVLTDACKNINNLDVAVIAYSTEDDEGIRYAMHGKQDMVWALLLQMLIGEVMHSVHEDGIRNEE